MVCGEMVVWEGEEGGAGGYADGDLMVCSRGFEAVSWLYFRAEWVLHGLERYRWWLAGGAGAQNIAHR